MIARIYKLLLVLIIVSLSLYIVLLNHESANFFISSNVKFSASSGVIYISLFTLGIVFTTLVALWFGLKSYLRERRLLSRDKQRHEFYQGMLKARGFVASSEWLRAAEEWQRLIKKDPTNIISHVELSRCLEASGDAREALKVLEAARQVDPTNSEVLFRAAELNNALGNKTAAIDNLVLVLHNHPSKKAASMARALSEELERFSDALEYQNKLESFGISESESEDQNARLEFEKLLFEARNNSGGLENGLKDFLKKYADFVPALDKLAALEAELGKVDEAQQLLIKAAKLSQDPNFWFRSSKLWLKNNQPDRALSAARSATRDTTGPKRLESELNLIRTLISLNMLTEAKSALEGFTALAQHEKVALTNEQRSNYLAISGLCYNRLGNYDESLKALRELCQGESEARESRRGNYSASNGSAPSPSLSTP